ncbi:MAG: hypothetical protein IPN15_02200 [Saprospiraceae bacterium]|nr:hypothetical protein [Candidatus Vicinibacter affinis]
MNLLINEIKKILEKWPITLIAYVVQLTIVMPFGLDLYAILKNSIGNSIQINELTNHYNHTVISDFLSQQGSSIKSLLNLIKYTLVLWLLISTFLNAGILFSTVNNNIKNGATFFKGCALYFISNLKFNLIFHSLNVIVITILFVPFALNLESLINYFSSEKYIFIFLMILLITYAFLFIVIFLWSTVSKLHFIQNNFSIGKCILLAQKSIINHKLKLFQFIFIITIFQIGLFYLYFVLQSLLNDALTIILILLFLLQQSFMILKIQIKQLIYSGIFRLVNLENDILN